MCVDIDEAGCKHATRGVDYPASIDVKVEANADDVTVIDCDVTAKPRTTSTVDDTCVLY
jgi:hypothetical protein